MRSIDAGWEVDEALHVPGIYCRGYLHFGKEKLYIYGEQGGCRTLSSNDFSFLGDNLYRFDNNSKIGYGDTYWRIIDGKVKYHGYFTKNDFHHHFILFGDESDKSQKYNIYTEFRVDCKIVLVRKDTNFVMSASESQKHLDYEFYCNMLEDAFFDFLGYPLKDEYAKV